MTTDKKEKRNTFIITPEAHRQAAEDSGLAIPDLSFRFYDTGQWGWGPYVRAYPQLAGWYYQQSGDHKQRVYLYAEDLTAWDGRGANLYGAIITHSRLDGADLTGANLTNATIKDSLLRHAIMDGVDLETITIIDSDTTGTINRSKK